MSLFKKKLNTEKATDYLIQAFESLVSDVERQSHEEKLQRIKTELPALENVKQKVFDDNLIAANLVILRSAWSIFILMQLGAAGMTDYKTEQLVEHAMTAVPDIKKYQELYSYYNVEAGPGGMPSLEDKVGGLFVENILPDDDKKEGGVLNELYDVFAALFHGSMKADLIHMKQSKLIT